MKGKYTVKVGNNRVQYKFEICRNITILKGNSATGKTTLIELIGEYNLKKNQSGVDLQCEKECKVITSEEWQRKITESEECICFIDEDNDFVTTVEFAELIKQTSNYYVIVMRDKLPHLPYSVDEMYELTNVTRGYGKIKRLYTCFKRIYQSETIHNYKKDLSIVICEDSGAGYEFFKNYFEKYNIECISANGNSNIYKEILKRDRNESILIIGDGAAFGPEIERVLGLKKIRNLSIFLPESFEWLILESGIVKATNIKDILENTHEYVESSVYFSWEQFFTATLLEMSKGTYFQYNKKRLNPVYLQDKEMTMIMKEYLD